MAFEYDINLSNGQTLSIRTEGQLSDAQIDEIKMVEEQKRNIGSNAINTSPVPPPASPSIENSQGGYNSPENEQRIIQKDLDIAGRDDDQFTPATTYNKNEQRLREVASGALWEWADEAEALVRSKVLSQGEYDDILKELNDKQDAFRSDHSGEALAHGLLGGVFTGGAILKLVKNSPKIMKLIQNAPETSAWKKVAKLIGFGAGSGALMGAGASRSDKDELENMMAMYGTMGAILPASLIGGGKVIGGGYQGVKNLIKRFTGNENSQDVALTRIAEALNKEGITTNEIRAELNKLRKLGYDDAQLADVFSRGKTLLRQASTVGGGDDVAESILNKRTALPQQLTQGLRQKLGINVDDADDWLFKLEQKQAQQAKQAYPNAGNTLINRSEYNVNGQDILDNKVFRNAWEKYSSEINDSLATPEKLPTFDELLKMDAIPTNYLHKIKRGLDSIISDGTDNLTGKMTDKASATQKTKRIFDDITRKNNPEYAKANDQFADSMKLKTVHKKGQNWRKLTKPEMNRYIDSLNADELQAFKIGVLDDIQNQAFKFKGGDFTRAVYGNEQTRQMFKKLFPNEADLKSFEDMVKYAKNMVDKTTKVIGGSQTATRQVEDEIAGIASNPTISNTQKAFEIINVAKSKIGMSEAEAKVLQKALELSSPAEQNALLLQLEKRVQELLAKKAKDEALKGSINIVSPQLSNELLLNTPSKLENKGKGLLEEQQPTKPNTTLPNIGLLSL